MKMHMLTRAQADAQNCTHAHRSKLAHSTAKSESDWVSCGFSSVKQINLSRPRPLFHMDERVLIKADPVPKGSSLYHGPYTVEEVLSQFTFWLSNGQHWSVRAMKHWWEPWMDDAENMEMPDKGDREQTTDGTDRGHAEAPASPGRLLPTCSTRKNAGIPPERWSYPAPV